MKYYFSFGSFTTRSWVVLAVALLSLAILPADTLHSQTTGKVAEPPVGIAGAAESIADTPPVTSVVNMLFRGSVLGLVIVVLILLLSIVSTYFVIVHAVTITRNRLFPEQAMTELERMLAEGEINSAVAFCHNRDNWSLATEVIAAGLQRYQSSEFGFAEYRSAVEEAGEDQVGRLYRKTEVLNVIGSIAPMLGLLGTVVGMIEAFMTIASRQGLARPEDLAGGIGQALVTTLLGLVVAIPTMVALSYFRTKIDSLVSEAGKRIERIMSPLGRKKS